MIKPQNIQIPLTLFNKIISFFEYLDFSGYKKTAAFDFDGILSELHQKQRSINLRAAYTDAVIANDNENKRLAYYKYLKLKNTR